jgi:hypothetical protein
MTSPVRARAILEHDFLGTDDVARRLGLRFDAAQAAQLAEIPFSETVLAASRGTHMLFAGAPVSLLDLRAGPAGGLLYPARDAWYEKMPFAAERVGVRWHLMCKGIFPGSGDKTFDEQRALAAGYEVPRACELVFGLLVYFLARGVRLLDRGALARCRDRVARYGGVADGNVNVGRFEERGLSVETLWLNYRLHYLGLAASRKLPGS